MGNTNKRFFSSIVIVMMLVWPFQQTFALASTVTQVENDESEKAVEDGTIEANDVIDDQTEEQIVEEIEEEQNTEDGSTAQQSTEQQAENNASEEDNENLAELETSQQDASSDEEVEDHPEDETFSLDRPNHVQLSTKTDTTITLKWEAVEGADVYDVFVDGEIVGTTEDTTYTVTTLSPNTSYELSIKAVAKEGSSEVSDVLTVKTNEAYTDDEILDFTNQHTFTSEAHKALIEVLAFDEHYDYDEAQKMIDRIGRLPNRIIEEAVKSNVRLVFTDFAITYLPEYHSLRGVVPRGWEETGRTWDDVPGAGGQLTVARIGHSDYGKGHSTVNLEYHEFGHAIDGATLGYKINALEEFALMHKEEKPKLWDADAHNSYYFDYPEEYFAETLAFYFLGGEEKERLKTNAPKTYAFMESLGNRFFSVDVTTTGITLSWDVIEQAAHYEIYRDQEKIGTSETAQFTDVTFTSIAQHEYMIKAIDATGLVVNETFTREVQAPENKVEENEATDTDDEEIDEEITDDQTDHDEGLEDPKEDPQQESDIEDDSSEKNEETVVTPEKNHHETVDENGIEQAEHDANEEQGGHELPKTATNMYNGFLVGMLLLCIGGVAYGMRKKLSFNQ